VTGHATASRRATAARYDDPRITSVGLLMETVGGLNARLAAQYAEHDLSAVEFEVLLRLARSPEQQLRMTDLATQTMLTTSGITRVIDRLERDGLVARSACPTDRRGSNATITEDGIERLNGVLPGHLDLLEKWFTGQLDQNQLAGLLEGLRVIRDAVRPGATAGANSA